jgi:hypothetical protein
MGKSNAPLLAQRTREKWGTRFSLICPALKRQATIRGPFGTGGWPIVS